MAAITSALVAICGTHFGDTKAAASMFWKPALVRRFTSSILTRPGRFPSRSAGRRAGRLRRF
jgi:hypothetical protein